MKKFVFFIVAALFSTLVFAQDKKVTEIKTSQLPKEVNDFIKKNMPGSTITRAGKVEEKGVVSYLAVLERQGTKHAYQFDKEGKLIGKADNLFKDAGKKPASPMTDPPQAKPPVKTGTATPAQKAPAAETATPKK